MKLDKSVLIWGAVFTLLFIGTLWYRPLLLEDETRYAEVAREMIATGDWVSPKMDGADYFEKPVLGHWLNAIAMTIFGENNFAVRFFQGFLTLLTGFGLYFFARPHGEKLARMATMIFFTTALVFAVGTYAVLDAQFSFFTFLTFVGFYMFAEENNKKRMAMWLVVTGVALGLAFLAKGFIAIAITTATCGIYILWRRKWAKLATSPWIIVLIAAAVALPWCIAVHKASPDFWRYFFIEEHVDRVLGKSSAKHPEPFWYFIVALPLVAMPWTLLWPAAFAGFHKEWKSAFSTPIMKFSLLAFAVPFVIVSASSGKLATYILPCMPFLAIITARGLERCAERRIAVIDVTMKVLSRVLLAAIIMFILFQLMCFTRLIPAKYAIWLPHEQIRYFAVMVMVIFFAGAVKKTPAIEGILGKIACIAAGICAVMLAIHFTMPSRFIHQIAPEMFMAKHIDKINSDTTVIVYKKYVASIAWLLKRDDIVCYDAESARGNNAGELTYGFGRPGQESKMMTLAQIEELVADPAKHVVFISSKLYHADRMPVTDSFSIDNENEFVFLEYNRP